MSAIYTHWSQQYNGTFARNVVCCVHVSVRVHFVHVRVLVCVRVHVCVYVGCVLSTCTGVSSTTTFARNVVCCVPVSVR